MLARPLAKYVLFHIVCFIHSGRGLPGSSHRPDRDRCTSASKQMWGEAGVNGQLARREDRRFPVGCCPRCSRQCGAHRGSLQTGSPAGHFIMAFAVQLWTSTGLFVLRDFFGNFLPLGRFSRICLVLFLLFRTRSCLEVRG